MISNKSSIFKLLVLSPNGRDTSEFPILSSQSPSVVIVGLERGR
ncbi:MULTISPECIES: hypothetical protein [unclassified Trichocoleus]|nr:MULTISPECIES: hypothetical protein [unclassified Trichocoleus]